MCVCMHMQERQGEREIYRRYPAGFEDGEGDHEPGNRSGFQKLLKEMDFPYSLQKECSPTDTLFLIQ